MTTLVIIVAVVAAFAAGLNVGVDLGMRIDR
jgi:hypothetical protein